MARTGRTVGARPERVGPVPNLPEQRPSLWGPLGKLADLSATIDRNVAARGYCRRNVRWVAKFANNTKGSMSDLDFANWWEGFKMEIRRRRI
jgi:hypothetical protein